MKAHLLDPQTQHEFDLAIGNAHVHHVGGEDANRNDDDVVQEEDPIHRHRFLLIHVHDLPHLSESRGRGPSYDYVHVHDVNGSCGHDAKLNGTQTKQV